MLLVQQRHERLRAGHRVAASAAGLSTVAAATIAAAFTPTALTPALAAPTILPGLVCVAHVIVGDQVH